MIRDEELQRLIDYVKGIGLKVTFSSKKSDASALWYLDNTEIVIFKSSNTSKTETILSLVHEIGHALHNIHEKDRKIDPKFSDALDHIDKSEEKGIDPQKRQRKIILNNEIAGTNYWEQIYKETNLKFPIWKLYAAMEYDMFQYEYFYETGDYPSLKERRKKLKEINNKHRKK